MEGDIVEPLKELSMIDRIRNMWEFANLAQWIYIFGRAVKIDETLDVEVSASLTFTIRHSFARTRGLPFIPRTLKWSA